MSTNIQDAFIEHVLGSTVALFAGLEHEENSSRKRSFALTQHFRSAGEHRNMCVVTTGMHDVVDF